MLERLNIFLWRCTKFFVLAVIAVSRCTCNILTNVNGLIKATLAMLLLILNYHFLCVDSGYGYDSV